MNNEKKDRNNTTPAQDPASHQTPPPPPETEPVSPSDESVLPEPGQLPDPRDQEIATLKDRLLRLQADFDNFRKRMTRDREDQARRACESLLKELLPVMDHFELGLRSAAKHHVKHTVIDGLSGVLKQMELVLGKAGVTTIETKSQAFDPHLHECVAHIPSETHAENMIIEETRRGYLLGTFLLRASQVIVSNGSAAQTADSADDAATSTDD
jgi:molecular chaperone GrpE